MGEEAHLTSQVLSLRKKRTEYQLTENKQSLDSEKKSDQYFAHRIRKSKSTEIN